LTASSAAMPALFGATCVGLHLVLARLVRRDRSLAPAERWCAALTFQFAFWTALSLALGFAGYFQLFFLVNFGVASLAILWAVVALTPAARVESRAAGRGRDAHATLLWLRDLDAVSRVALVFGLVSALWFLALGVRLPPVSFDALSYHLGLAIHLYQDGDFRNYIGESFMANHFARGANLPMAITMMLSGSIAFANCVQWLILPVAIPAVYTGSRAMGADRSLATIAAMLPLAVPGILYQSSMAYVDLFSTGWLAVGFCAVMGARRFDGVGPVRMLWMFAAAGLALGAKLNAAPHCLVLGATAMVCWGWRAFIGPPRRALAMAVAGFAIAAAVGLPWAMRNWIGYGSPTYPIMLTENVESLERGEYPFSIARRMSEPDPEFGQSLWRKTYDSWTGWDAESWRRLGFLGHRISKLDHAALTDASYGYTGDGKRGEFGLLWMAALLPALVAVAFVGRARDRRWFLALAVAPFAAYLATVAGWWPRFTLFLPFLGVLAAAAVIARLRATSRSLAHAALALVLACALFDWSTAIFLNRQWERAERYWRDAKPASYSPIHFKSWEQPASPLNEAILFTMQSAKPGDTISYWTPGNGVFTGLFATGDAGVRQYLFPSIWPDPHAVSPREMLRHIRAQRIRLILLSRDADPEIRALLGRHGGKLAFSNGEFDVWKIE